jgi:hypothetical protein
MKMSDVKLKGWFWLNGSLDRKYLRVCVCYRLLKRGVIGQARALELLSQVHTKGEMKTIAGTVEMWKAGPLKNMAA